jgi:5'-deoxynucleotidase YfbR-like HD superfamily hydrolase
MIEILYDRLNWLYNGTETRRFHGRRMIHQQTVGEHSLRMCLLLLCVNEWSKDASARSTTDMFRLLRAAVLHDLAEHVVGDIPSPTKHDLNINKEVDKLEAELLMTAGGLPIEALSIDLQTRLKFVDCLDGMMTCGRERELGNTTLDDVYEQYHRYLSMLDLSPAEQELRAVVFTLWSNTHGPNN